ncbi:uncharacterized protein PHACADRAFT_256232 [Phanerochaete carnosa HHB-10118-sp]|uniref:Secreted protein n=1 Tax=Phanerochaete carnosa (strain HHB-10118-sp) TaxID=650164 RepID=K5W8L5_PHACS|nr:uncharacterized protein PHACADRAFT_256232 [Phanerochaete carnosa HHB-10118-sp]EKM55535.1 hypothetical protein PHACADRAFT_256232 [Phanerochaete carnosa HHB-10118-sp]
MLHLMHEIIFSLILLDIVTQRLLVYRPSAAECTSSLPPLPRNPLTADSDAEICMEGSLVEQPRLAPSMRVISATPLRVYLDVAHLVALFL